MLALLGAGTTLDARAIDERSGLYDHTTLEYWGPRYQDSTQQIFDQIIYPALSNDERARLANVRLDISLHANGPQKRRSSASHAPFDGLRIVIPVSSLKFLDDLCTAYAWLQISGHANDYSLMRITEYTAKLRFSTVLPTPALAPLNALGIPPLKFGYPRVAELALRHFTTARTFLLAHELGHAYHRHRVGTGTHAREYEEIADHFAADLLSRTLIPPLGSLVFFMAEASSVGYPELVEGTHPLSSARLRSLANRVEYPAPMPGLAAATNLLEYRNLAQGLRTLAQLMDGKKPSAKAPSELDDVALLAQSGPRLPDKYSISRLTMQAMVKGGAPFVFDC